MILACQQGNKRLTFNGSITGVYFVSSTVSEICCWKSQVFEIIVCCYLEKFYPNILLLILLVYFGFSTLLHKKHENLRIFMLPDFLFMLFPVLVIFILLILVLFPNPGNCVRQHYITFLLHCKEFF